MAGGVDDDEGINAGKVCGYAMIGVHAEIGSFG